MQTRPGNWKQLFTVAQSEKDAQRRSELCEQARRLIQDRSLEIAESKPGQEFDAAEEDILNQALRDLWILQNRPS